MTNHYEELMKKAMSLAEKKAYDYSQANDRFSNFKRAAVLVSWFTDPVDQVFACMIGIKITRKAELVSGKTPNFESLADTDIDLVNYCALWGAYGASKIVVGDDRDEPNPLPLQAPFQVRDPQCAICGKVSSTWGEVMYHVCKGPK